jgi:hypothetical protein
LRRVFHFGGVGIFNFRLKTLCELLPIVQHCATITAAKQEMRA